MIKSVPLVVPQQDEQNPESEAESSRTIVHSPTSTSLAPRKWMPPELPTTMTFTATASYVDEEGSIFLQPKSSECSFPSASLLVLPYNGALRAFALVIVTAMGLSTHMKSPR